MLELRGLSKSFGSTAVLREVSLTIRRGEFVSLLGPSGCGKTTTLRIIAGFMAPDAGQVILDGERIDRKPSHSRGAAMVFQNYALFPHMTVAENVGFGLRMRKEPKPQIRSKVHEALKAVRLEALAARFPRELSGGQQQRVALARAIVLRPKLLLLDEPLSNLDAKLRKELRAEFLTIHEIAGTTTIFVTHDLEEAFAVSDRIAVMNHGRLEQYGSAMEIYSRPASEFVADFLGHSNVLAGVVQAGGVLVVPGAPSTLLAPPGLEAGSPVRLAVPAHLIAVATTPMPRLNAVRATVKALSYQGSTVHYELEAGWLSLTTDVPARPDSQVFARGDEVFACWSPADFIPLPAARP